MSLFGVPLSGLIASQQQLQSVSNNLANLSTVGYKDQNVSFSDIFAQSSLNNGTNDPVQTGLGVKASQTSSDFSDGATTATNVSSNMALSGNGFFVTRGADGANEYTRAGDFTANASGQLTTPNGELVLGYPAVNGAISTSAPLQPLQIGLGSVIPATASTGFSLTANLSANATVGTSFSSTTPIYDSLGTSHELSVTFTKAANNSWNYSVDVPTADTGAASTTLKTGTLSFDTNGNLASPLTAQSISISNLADGAASMNLSWSLVDKTGVPTITQTNLASTTTATSQDGHASGVLDSYAVQADGTVEGTYSNGQTMALGQVAVANFANTQGLLRTGNNNYEVTEGSGLAQIGVAGTGGRGVITGGSVESSNVDVAAEFAKMIVAQQAYQANAKTVTTLSQISQATIQMMAG